VIPYDEAEDFCLFLFLFLLNLLAFGLWAMAARCKLLCPPPRPVPEGCKEGNRDPLLLSRGQHSRSAAPPVGKEVPDLALALPPPVLSELCIESLTPCFVQGRDARNRRSEDRRQCRGAAKSTASVCAPTPGRLWSMYTYPAFLFK